MATLPMWKRKLNKRKIKKVVAMWELGASMQSLTPRATAKGGSYATDY